MSYPADMSTRNITGVFLGASSSPKTGALSFTPSAILKDAAGATILHGSTSVELDTNGSFTVQLPCTDDRDLSPVGWHYTLRTRISGVRPTEVSFYLPLGDGSDVDITELNLADYQVQAPLASSVSRGPVGPAPALGTAVPLMDGIGSAGTATVTSRENHVHPTDTSRVDTTDPRLSDARTPSSTLAHKTSHAAGGSDALAPSDIGAVPTAQGMVVVTHGTDGAMARPTGVGAVYWIGSATPANAVNYDIWWAA
jgi:hypothetical protein